jgi:hypothetical protein
VDDGAPSDVLKADDWTSMPFDDLARRIGRTRASYDDSISRHICEPKRDGILLGRFRVVRSSSGASRALTIGGFSARWDAPHLEGVAVGVEPRLDRTDGSTLLSDDELRQQLRDVVHHGFVSGHAASPELGSYLLSKGVVPHGLRCFIASNADEDDFEILDFDGLVDWAKAIEPGKTCRIVENDSFPYEDEFNASTDLSIRDILSKIVLEKGVVIAPGPKRNRWAPEAPKQAGPQSQPDVPTSLKDLAISAVCRAWSCTEDDTDVDTANERVGTFELRDGTDNEVCIEVTRLRRPSGE